MGIDQDINKWRTKQDKHKQDKHKQVKQFFLYPPAADVTNVMVQEPTGTGQGLTIAPCLALHVDTLVFVLYVMVAGALITQNTDNNY